MNRVGDMGVSIGFFAMLALFGSLNYSTLFNITPFVNETSITIISLLIFTGTMAKSAQLPLVTWLSNSMEGRLIKIKILFYFIFIIFIYLYFIYKNLDYNINIYYSILPPILTTISKEILNIITGNMLGDGSIQYNKVLKNGQVNAKYGMTMDIYSLNYLKYLYDTVYGQFSLSGIHPYPNIMLGKTITQYSFNTRSLPLFSNLHNIWYTWNKDINKFIKIVPSNISEMFTEIAYWIMDDGYFDNYGRTKTILLCTETNVFYFN